MTDEELIKKLAGDYEKLQRIYTSKTKAWLKTLDQYPNFRTNSAEQNKDLRIKTEAYLRKNKAETREQAKETPLGEDEDYELEKERLANFQKDRTEIERQENFEKFRENPGTEVQPPLFPLR